MVWSLVLVLNPRPTQGWRRNVIKCRLPLMFRRYLEDFEYLVKLNASEHPPLRKGATAASASLISLATDHENPHSFKAFNRVSTSDNFCTAGQSLGPPSSAPGHLDQHRKAAILRRANWETSGEGECKAQKSSSRRRLKSLRGNEMWLS